MTEEEIRQDERKKIAHRILKSDSHKMYHAMNGGGFSPDWCDTCRFIQALGFTVEKPKKPKAKKKRSRKRK